MVSHVQNPTAFSEPNEKKKSKKNENNSNLECNNNKISKKNHKKMDKISFNMSATDPVPKKKKKLSTEDLSDFKDFDVSSNIRNKVPKKKKSKHAEGANIESSDSMAKTDVPKTKKRKRGEGANIESSDSLAKTDAPKTKKRKEGEGADIGSSESLTKADLPTKKKKKQASDESFDTWDSTADNVVPNMEINKNVSSKDIDVNIANKGNVAKKKKIFEKNGISNVDKKKKKRSKKETTCILVSEEANLNGKLEATAVLPLHQNNETQELFFTTNRVTVSETKKKKKRKSRPDEINLETKSGNTTVDGTIPQKEKKKKKKNRPNKNAITDVLRPQKEKKKKRKILFEESAEIIKSEIEKTDSFIPKEEKKKKKKREPEKNSDLANCDNAVNDVLHQQTKRKKKKKTEKGSDLTNGDNVVNDVLPQQAKRKKKRKTEKGLTNGDNAVNGVLPQLRKKKKEKPEKDNVVSDVLCHQRKTKKFLSDKTDEVKMDETEMPQNAKKKLKAQPEGNAGVKKCENVDADVLVTQAEKKKKTQKKECVTEIGAEATVSEVIASKRKKKVTSSTLEDEVFVDCGHLGRHSKTSKTEKKKKSVSFYKESQGLGTSQNGRDTDSSRDLDEKCAKEVAGVKEKQKNKEEKEQAELPAESGQHQDITSHIEENKKMSKKKREKVALLNKEQETNDTQNDIPKKKKKGKEAKKISKNKTAHSSDQQDGEDVHVVSMKPGNADEVQIDAQGTKFGQWGTATFQSTEQQTKFFRLLGGFKKGNEAAASPSPIQKKPNMALGEEGQLALNRSLLAEFDQALTRKQNRGIGLGFQAQHKKTFYIDKTASKSTRFLD